MALPWISTHLFFPQEQGFLYKFLQCMQSAPEWGKSSMTEFVLPKCSRKTEKSTNNGKTMQELLGLEMEVTAGNHAHQCKHVPKGTH